MNAIARLTVDKKSGDTVTIKISIKNIGTVSADFPYKIDGKDPSGVVDYYFTGNSGSLSPNGVSPIFTHTQGADYPVGTWTVVGTVYKPDMTFITSSSATYNVLAETISAQVDSITTSVPSVAQGQTFTATALYTNTGDAGRSFYVEIAIQYPGEDYEYYSGQTVTIAKGAHLSQNAPFTLTGSDPVGTWNVSALIAKSQADADMGNYLHTKTTTIGVTSGISAQIVSFTVT